MAGPASDLFVLSVIVTSAKIVVHAELLPSYSLKGFSGAQGIGTRVPDLSNNSCTTSLKHRMGALTAISGTPHPHSQ